MVVKKAAAFAVCYLHALAKLLLTFTKIAGVGWRILTDDELPSIAGKERFICNAVFDADLLTKVQTSYADLIVRRTTPFLPY